MPGRRRITNAFLVAYLAVQLLVPLRGLIHDRLETRGDFSWNMYSSRYACKSRYWMVARGGHTVAIDHSQFLHDPSDGSRVFHRDVLPRFHRWLCEGLREAGIRRPVHASVRCSVAGRPHVDLVRPDVDLCTAPNHGVIE